MNRLILILIGICLCCNATAGARDVIDAFPSLAAATPPSATAGAPPTPGGTGILGTILFRTDSAEVEQALWPVLRGVVAAAIEHPDRVIELEGHSDVRGSRNHNRTLSSRRAGSVAKFLIDSGVSPKRIRTLGYGESRASTNVKDPGGHIFDRRVTIFLRLKDGSI